MSQITRLVPTSGPGSGTVTSVSGGNNITITGNPAVNPTVNVSGTTNHAVQVGNASGSLTSIPVGTTGQILTGVTGADPVFATPVVSIQSLTTDDANVVTPAGGTIILHGTHGLNTTGTVGPNTATIAINNAIVLGDLVALGAGVAALTATTGDVAITAGNLTLPDTNTGGTHGRIIFNANTFIQDYPTGSANFMAGFLVGNTSMTGTGNNGIGGGVFSMLTSGGENCGFGHTSLQTIKTGNRNSAYGEGSLNGMDSGNNNCAYGFESAWLVSSGSNNSAYGQLAGSAWTGADSNNIAINNIGVLGDSGKIRIGTNATHTATFIAGIDTVNVGSVAKVVTMASDQLGTAAITAGTGISVTPGANTITIATSGVSNLTVTTVNHAASPYTVLSTDSYLAVNTSGGVVSILLPNAPAAGRVFYIKDSNGTAAASNITITTVGGVVLIDGATTFVMNTAFEAASVVFTSAYEVF